MFLMLVGVWFMFIAYTDTGLKNKEKVAKLGLEGAESLAAERLAGLEGAERLATERLAWLEKENVALRAENTNYKNAYTNMYTQYTQCVEPGYVA
jgi:hypothetical protein